MPLIRRSLLGLAVPLLLLTACSGDEESSSTDAEPSQSASAAAPDDAEVVDALIARGLAKVESDEHPEARRLFTSVLDLDPGNVYAHYNLGYLAQLEGETASALMQYNAALEAQSDFAPALYNLAILTEPADLRAAVDLYRRVVDSNGGDAGTYFRLGHALISLGERDEGEQLVAQAVELDASLAGTSAPAYR